MKSCFTALVLVFGVPIFTSCLYAGSPLDFQAGKLLDMLDIGADLRVIDGTEYARAVSDDKTPRLYASIEWANWALVTAER